MSPGRFEHLLSHEATSELSGGERLRIACELREQGIFLFRRRLRREHPEWSDAELAAAVDAWLAQPTPPLPPDLAYTTLERYFGR